MNPRRNLSRAVCQTLLTHTHTLALPRSDVISWGGVCGADGCCMSRINSSSGYNPLRSVWEPCGLAASGATSLFTLLSHLERTLIEPNLIIWDLDKETIINWAPVVFKWIILVIATACSDVLIAQNGWEEEENGFVVHWWQWVFVGVTWSKYNL